MKSSPKRTRNSGYRYGTWWTVHTPKDAVGAGGAPSEQSKDSDPQLAVARKSVRSLPAVGHIEFHPRATPSQRFELVGPKVVKCASLVEAEQLARGAGSAQ